MALTEWCPTAELTGTESERIVRIELPETALKNVSAQVDGLTLTVNAERELPTYASASSHRAACFSATFGWRFALPVALPANLVATEVDGSVVTLRFAAPVPTQV